MTQEEKLKGLGIVGYAWGHQFDPNEFTSERIDAIRAIIKGRLEKRKTINHDVGTSYGLKHRIEKHSLALGFPLRGYISNGECIYAMILEGFDVYKCGPNAKFNVTSKSFRL